MIGKSIGGFLVESLLGSGGMGEVYRAFDPQLGRPVALKVLRPESRMDEGHRSRLLREARILARLSHPAICTIHSVITEEDMDVLVLELVDGRTLGALGRIDAPRAMEIAEAIADALAAAHAAGVVHRDLKPANVMLTAEGEVRILDFGIARSATPAHVAAPVVTASPAGMDPSQTGGRTVDLAPVGPEATGTGFVVGTPRYLAPEVAAGWPATPAADVFALGLTLLEMLTGKPCDGRGALEVVVSRAAGESPPIPPGVPAGLSRLLAWMLDPEPRRRPSAEEVRRELLRLRNRPSRIRRRLLAAAAALGMLALLGSWTGERIRNRRVARIAADVGDRTSRIEWMVRTEHMAPAHSLAGLRGRVAGDLASIRRRAGLLGPRGAAATHEAQGRAAFALRDFRRATRELEQAWSLGNRSQAVAQPLVTCLYWSYLDGLRGLGDIRDREKRAGKLRELEAATVERAREVARTSGALLRRTSFAGVVAQLARGRLEPAGRRARALLLEEPWRYEGAILAAEAMVSAADREISTGGISRARNHLEGAAALLERVAPVARSDPWLARVDATLAWLELTLARGREGRDISEPLAREMSELRAALRIAPDDPELLLAWSRLLALRAATVDPGEASDLLHRSAENAERAVQRRPEDARFRDRAGTAWFDLARLQADSGEDASPAFQRASEHFAAVGRLDPDSRSNTLRLAGLYLYWGRWKTGRGEDPEPLFREGDRLTSTLPGDDPYTAIRARFARAGISLARGEALEARGSPAAGDAFRRAIATYRSCLSPDRVLPGVRFNIGLAALGLARTVVRGGKDPGQPLRIVEGEGRTLVESAPGLGYGPILVGSAHALRAETQERAGRDPSRNLRLARASFRRAMELDPSNRETAIDLAATHLIEARWRLRRNRSVSPATAAALRLLDPVLREGSTSARVFLTAAEAELLAAESLLTGERSRALASLERARRLAGKAAALNPSLARAELLLAWAAAVEAEAVDRGGPAREGLRHLGRARELDPTDPDLPWLGDRLSGLAGRRAPRPQASGSL